MEALARREATDCRKANFNIEGFQVGLPVFTIHGNHDDPSGADNLSAVDVLSTCKLVNYFGKTVTLWAGSSLSKYSCTGPCHGWNADLLFTQEVCTRRENAPDDGS